jgi:hypothetical protein
LVQTCPGPMAGMASLEIIDGESAAEVEVAEVEVVE